MRRDAIVVACTVLVAVSTVLALYMAEHRNKCCSQLVIVSSDFVDSRGEQRSSGNWLPGCQDVCYFRAEDFKRDGGQAVTHVLGGSELNLTTRLLAQSPGLGRATRHDGLLVYNVLPGTPHHPWRQIVQTASLASPPKRDSVIHVVLLNRDNVVLVYDAAEKNGSAAAAKPSRDSSWSPREESLVYQNELVLTEIAWEERSADGVYHVSWEVDGGGLKGHLFTDATRVTLTLWPETTYHVQVEMVSRTPDSEIDQSEQLTVDTSRAKHMAEAKDEMEFQTVRDLLSGFESFMRKEEIASDASHSSLILGCLAAICLFSLSAAAVIMLHRRIRHASKSFEPSDGGRDLHALEGDFCAVSRDGEHF